jgi:hypothetical protein
MPEQPREQMPDRLFPLVRPDGSGHADAVPGCAIASQSHPRPDNVAKTCNPSVG